MPNPSVTHVIWLSERPGSPAFSGAEIHLMTLLPALARAGADVELLAIVLNDGPQIREQLEALAAAGVTVSRLNVDITHRYKRRDPRLAWYFARLVGEWRNRRQRILHMHLDWIYAPAAAWIARAPHVVMSVHVDDPLWERPRWQWWLRRVDPVIARYICISSRVAEHLAAIVPAAAPRIRRIYYGIELPPTEPDRGEARRRLGLADDAFVAGFVGRLAPQKNLEAITGAAAERPDMQFVLIGDGGERERMDRAAARLPNLRVLGHRPDAAACMHAFDVLCLPSHFEGLGLVLLEAMSRGVLALGSDAGAIPEILDGGRAGVVFDRRNPTGFVAALDWIREHRADAAALALAGRKRVHDTFTTAAMTDATLSVYQEVRAIGEGQN